LLSFDAVTDFAGAVKIYRRCRAAGVTPRGMIDCISPPWPGVGMRFCLPMTQISTGSRV
jgi:hypothetical protein